MRFWSIRYEAEIIQQDGVDIVNRFKNVFLLASIIVNLELIINYAARFASRKRKINVNFADFCALFANRIITFQVGYIYSRENFKSLGWAPKFHSSKGSYVI